MRIEPRVVGGFISLLCLGILLGILPPPLQAEDRSIQLLNGPNTRSGSVQHNVPQARRPSYSPPVFMDRSTPMSERSFATPFFDRSAPMSERRLPPIGGGGQVAPGSVPLIWCRGEWIRADSPGHRCSSR
jgi:hypothetical protein